MQSFFIISQLETKNYQKNIINFRYSNCNLSDCYESIKTLQKSRMQREQIRINRQRIRKDLKACFVIPHPLLNQKKQVLDLKVQQEGAIRNRKRKTSLDFKNFDQFQCLKEIYISNTFLDLFILGEKLGQGTQSVVYKCQEIQTSTIYAVKIIRTDDPQRIRTIKEQYRILKSIQHEHIIRAYYLFINEIEATIHMVLQYCPYKDLRKYMNTNKNIRASDSSDIIGRILSALICMHTHKICHRDIKPQNILYNSQSGQLKIIDFQIAKMAKYQKERVEMCTFTGSLFYKAPQMFGGIYNEQIDLWAVGVILYEMCLGCFPFYSQFVQDYSRLVTKEQPNYECPNISPQCINFLKQLLKKNPLERINAKQSLKHPFILKFSNVSHSSSPKMGKNGSEQATRQEKQFEFNMEKCHDDNDQIHGKSQLLSDIGIRHYQKNNPQ